MAVIKEADLKYQLQTCLPRLLNWLRGLGGMKHLFIALIALTITLGVGCKKETVVEPEKQETTLSTKKLALTNPDDDGLEAKHSAACIKGEGRPMDYTCPGPSSCNPPK